MKPTRFGYTQCDIAFLRLCYDYSVETGNGRRLSPAYVFFLADRIYGPGLGQARAQLLRAAGHFTMEVELWLQMPHLTPVVTAHYPGVKPLNPPSKEECACLAAWQATGLSAPGACHWKEQPPPLTDSGSKEMEEKLEMESELLGILRNLILASDAIGRGLPPLEYNKVMGEYLMNMSRRTYRGDRFSAPIKARTKEIRDELKRRGFCVMGFDSTMKITDVGRAQFSPVPVEDPVPEPVPEPVLVVVVPEPVTISELDHVVEPTPAFVIPPVVEESEEVSPIVMIDERMIEQPISEPINEPVVESPPEPVPEAPVIEEPTVEPITEEPVSVVPEGELVRFPSELVRPPKVKERLAFRRADQSTWETYLANQHLLNQRCGGQSSPQVCKWLCYMTWPNAKNPFPQRSILKANGLMHSKRRRGEKADGWYVTEKGVALLVKYDVLPSLTEAQADQFIREHGDEPINSFRAV